MESYTVEASNETLMRQAGMTADAYLIDAIEAIEKRLGKGAAASNPALVAAFIQAAATDYQANIVARALGQLGEALTGAIDSLGSALGSRPQ